MKESGFEVDESIINQLRELGAPPEVLEAARQKVANQEDFELFEDCIESVTVFRRLRTQWCPRGGMDGGVSGLNYHSVEILMRRCQVPPARRDGVFEDIQIMEAETLNVIFERQQCQRSAA